MSLQPPYLLESLSVGAKVRGAVSGRQRNKLWVRMPVIRRVRGRRETKEFDAVLKLHREHPLIRDPEASVGKELNVFVQKISYPGDSPQLVVQRGCAPTSHIHQNR